MINYAVRTIINPLLKKQYPDTTYQLKHVIGIDTGELFIARIRVRSDNDLVWIGQAANYAAKLCSLIGRCGLYTPTSAHLRGPLIADRYYTSTALVIARSTSL